MTDTSLVQNCSCLTPFKIAVKVAPEYGIYAPVAGTNTYYHPDLIGAEGVDFIIVNNNYEVKLNNEFTFDSTTGIITRTNLWFDNDTLIISFSKLL